jgi:hypothetical protein
MLEKQVIKCTLTSYRTKNLSHDARSLGQSWRKLEIEQLKLEKLED